NIGKREEAFAARTKKWLSHTSPLFAPLPLFPLPPRRLPWEELNGVAFYTPAMTLRHHHVFFGNEILNIDLFFGLDDLRAPRIAVLFFQGQQFVLDDRLNARLTTQNGLVFLDGFQ